MYIERDMNIDEKIYFLNYYVDDNGKIVICNRSKN